MSDHPNVTAVHRMTRAVFEQDQDTLAQVLSPELEFHLRGPFAKAGDHHGIDGLLDALGSIFELTNGEIRLEQLFTVGTGEWAAEWERAELGRNGRILESKNAFVYRFDDDRIAEMWMFIGADPAESAAFFG